jgi:hypothetical protein
MPVFDNRFEGGGASNLPLAKVDSVRGAMVCATATPGQPRQWQTVPIGTCLVLDWGCRFYGGISFSPTVVEHVVLDGMPAPEIPSGVREWQPVIKLPILIEGRGLFMGSFTGKINQNRIRPLLQLFGLCAEAQKGLLQEYELRPFEPLTLEKGNFYALALQPGGWVERDPELFGPRLLAAPAPFVAGPVAPPKLSSGSDEAAAAAAANDPAANDHGPSWEGLRPLVAPAAVAAPPPPAPPPRSAAAPPAVNDQLARYRPAGAGRKAY